MATIEIPLQGKVGQDNGLKAVVDECDFPLVQGYRWLALRTKRSKTTYAVSYLCQGGTIRPTYMHRLVMDAPAGKQVDHRDGNGLNNSRSNLRLCEQWQNSANKAVAVGANGYRGIYKNKDCRKYYAAIWINGKRKYLGSSYDPMAAARLYDTAARERYGEFATVNFPD